MSLYASPAALNADAYKSGHFRQYPEGTTELFFNLTARSDKYLNTPLEKDGIIVFGIQRFVQDYLVDHWNNTFFKRPKEEVIKETMLVMNGVLGEGTITPHHWEELHDLGYLPVVVDAVPEGTLLPIQVPTLCFRNTDPRFAWVAGYLEDAFSNELWKSITIATIAFHYRRIMEKWADQTCDNNDHVCFQGHDFSLRGESGMNDGALNNVAHLSSFKGTDNFAAVYTANRVYGQGMDITEFGGSIPATEHSVMTANIAVNIHKMFGENADTGSAEQRLKGELETFRQFLEEKYPSGLLSLVSDSYDYWRTIGSIAAHLRTVIMKRPGKLVFRPDSGNPFHVVCGYKAIHFDDAKQKILARMENNPGYHGTLNIEYVKSIQEEDAHTLPHLDDWIAREGYEILIWNEDMDGLQTLNLNTKEQRHMVSEEIKGSVETLWEIFGGTQNNKGYKVLDPHVGLIYGDSITMEMADKILSRLAEMGFASSNIVFGVGSYTYQYITRDTLGFAVKATNMTCNGQELMLCKEPVTDMGLKKSAKGCVVPMVDSIGEIYAVDGISLGKYDEMVVGGETLFKMVFYNGVTYNQENLKKIRERVDFFI